MYCTFFISARSKRSELCSKTTTKDTISEANKTFMTRIITGDEMWVYEFNIKTKQQSLDCQEDEKAEGDVRTKTIPVATY